MLATNPDSTDDKLSEPNPKPFVYVNGDLLSLHFRDGMIQSQMKLSAPDELVLSYTRAMMCFALFNPAPRHILMIGLGGGSLAKYCYRYFPASRITVLENSAEVIALRGRFRIPADDGRFQVIHADAVEYLKRAEQCADVLLLDGFDANGLPPSLRSAQFHASCRKALNPAGMLVANIFSYESGLPVMLEQLHSEFDHRVCWFSGISGNNRIVFSVLGPVWDRQRTPRFSRPALVQRLVAFNQRFNWRLFNMLWPRLVNLWLTRLR